MQTFQTASLSNEQLHKLQQWEEQFSKETGKKIVLVAYQGQADTPHSAARRNG